MRNAFQATTGASKMVKSKSMEVMKAVQEDLGEVRIRVFHKNMFEKKIIATHHASAWGLV